MNTLEMQLMEKNVQTRDQGKFFDRPGEVFIVLIVSKFAER